ncbi:MAG: RHS repeat-associated core domain-containing protein [Vicingaceae bacterium]|nr:RHS repeat-associated core domain-containing protein [Vicingaceae bacterium]
MMPTATYHFGKEYRWHFNGKEVDNEVNGGGNSYDYGFRIYNPRLGRFLSIDPLFRGYPYYTPYQFAGNKPTVFIDLDGTEEAIEYVNALFSSYDALYVNSNRGAAEQRSQNSGLAGPEDGPQDAMRHTLWNALNARDIGADDAKPFADLHETAGGSFDPNSDEFNPVSVQMDFHNNHIGRRIGANNPNATDDEIEQLVIQALANGELKQIVTQTFTLVIGIDASGNNITQRVDIASDKNGNPVVPAANQRLVTLLVQNGITVNTNTNEKQLIDSHHPVVQPNSTVVPPSGQGYGAIVEGDSQTTTNTNTTTQPNIQNSDIPDKSDNTQVIINVPPPPK